MDTAETGSGDTGDDDTGVGAPPTGLRWSGIYAAEVDAYASILGVEETQSVGYTVADIGDVTGDGLPDLSFGSSTNRLLGSDLWVFPGPVSPGSVSSNDAAVHLLQGPDNTDLPAAEMVISPGDLDGDGVNELAVVAGLVCIVPGPLLGLTGYLSEHGGGCFAHPLIYTDHPFWPDDLGVGFFGNSAVADRDVTGDGIPDGLYAAGLSGGEAWLVPGPALMYEDVGAEGVSTTFHTADGQPHEGMRTVANPDLDADGLYDIVIGAPFAGEIFSQGEVLVALSPVPDGEFDPDGYDGVWSGEDDGDSIEDNLGGSLSRTGDVDGDGREDVVAGASGHLDDAGAAYVLTGPATGVHNVIEAHFKVLPYWGGGFLGQGLSEAKDLDHDGHDDLMVGAEGGGIAPDYWGGMVGLYYGPIYAGVTDLGEADARFTMVEMDARLGQGLSSPGDLTGDGWPDLALGAPHAEGSDGVLWGGGVYVFAAPGG